MRARLALSVLLVGVLAGLPVVAGEMRELVWIGFQNGAEFSRVYVKTNEQVQYKVSDVGADAVIIDLFDTRVQSRNHKRPMDTSQFDSPVLRIAAEELEGAARQVRVEIKLRHKVPYEVTQVGEVLSIDFKR
jgi:hypothetical protein